MGFLQSCFFIPLTWIGGKVEADALGTATGVLNGISFLPAFFLPWLAGGLMDAVDRPTSSAWLYSARAYYLGFALSAALLVASLLASAALFLRLRRRQHALAAGPVEARGPAPGSS